MISEFFAVTRTSVYHVEAGDEECGPTAKKIALRGESVFPVGSELGSGTRIAICKVLLVYIPPSEDAVFSSRAPGSVSMCYLVSNSSPIVALFKTKKEAMRCFKSKYSIPCDPRWIYETKTVLDEIGDDHPDFEVCRWPGLALIEEEEF